MINKSGPAQRLIAAGFDASNGHRHEVASYPHSLGKPLANPAGRERVKAEPLDFTDIFRSHAAYVLRLVRRLGVAECDAEDVAQEVFLAIHGALPQFQGRAKPKTWLCSICLHKVQDYRRQKYRRREVVSPSPPVECERDSAHDGLLRKERVELLQRILNRLPNAQLQVFVLFEMEELPMIEVARIVGCPIFTAYTRLRAARRHVRASFERAMRGGPP